MSVHFASLVLSVGFSILGEARSWSTPNQFLDQRNVRSRLSRETILFGSKHKTDDDTDSHDQTAEIKDELISTPTTAAYGVSYIGGDPCGSKYNDDPFDASKDVSKPGMPDAMKDRIAALAARMLECEDK